MSAPFLGEIKAFAFNFAPRHYAECNGALLDVQSNQSLFSLLGTNFGGDGKNTFGIPDLRGRAIMGGTPNQLGSKQGVETVRLSEANLPEHIHEVYGSGSAPGSASPAGGLPAILPDNWLRFREMSDTPMHMNASSLQDAGQGGDHENRQPFLTIKYCIALAGTYPSRN